MVQTLFFLPSLLLVVVQEVDLLLQQLLMEVMVDRAAGVDTIVRRPEVETHQAHLHLKVTMVEQALAFVAHQMRLVAGAAGRQP
jgi:hypothetical protein